MSSGEGSKPPKSLNLSRLVTSPVVSVSVGRSPLSTLRYVSGFSGEESLQSTRDASGDEVPMLYS